MSDFVDSIAESFLTEEQASEVVEQPATQPEPRQEAPSLDPQPEPQALEPERPEPGHIPIQALLDEREKRQEAARRADTLTQELAQLRQAQQANQPARPDLYDDPDAFAASIQQQQADMQFQMRAEMSANFARQKPGGEEELQAAIRWAGDSNSPALQYEFRNSRDPYALLIQKYKSDQLLSKIGDDPDAYVRQRYAELSAGSQTAQPVSQGATQQQPASKPAVRSLASQPNAGSGPTPLDAGFDSLTFNLDRKR